MVAATTEKNIFDVEIVKGAKGHEAFSRKDNWKNVEGLIAKSKDGEKQGI